MNNKLKPCPLCGAEAHMWSWNYGTAIQCSKFNSNNHVIQVSAESSAEAIERWNARAEGSEDDNDR